MEKSVSIIITCYNYGKYLGECIESVLAQTYPVHEIIVVDDESTDNTKEVVESIQNKYAPTSFQWGGLQLKYIWQKNKGLGGTRNTGIKEATGNLIMCLDADDKLVPAAIEEHVKLITDNNTIAQCALMEFGDRHAVNIPLPNTNLERVMQSNTIFCNAMFPKKAWEEVGGYDESKTMRAGYEDWEIWIRMLAKGYRVNTSDFIALRYRVHRGQMTEATAWPNKEKLYEYIMNKHKDLYEEKGLKIAGYK